MILAHLSELHLGFRAYERAERGRNVRERDVAAAFGRAVDAVVAMEPAVVVIVGDVFDRADPSPSAMLPLARELGTLRSALPEVPVVLTAGARDTPLLPGDAGALALFEALPGVFTATGTMRTVILESLDVALCMVPYRSGLRAPYPEPRPSPDVRHNVAVMYGTTQSGGVGVELDPSEWSYVALGGDHLHRQVAPNAMYAGSLERVGSRPWDEAGQEKGLVRVDLEAERAAFVPLPVRPMVALAPVRMPPDGAEGLRRRVAEVTDEIPGGIEEKIVRLEVDGARPRELLALQGDLLVGLRRRALHLELGVARDQVRPLSGPAARLLDQDGDELAGAVREVLSEAPSWTDRLRLADALDLDDPVFGRVELTLPEGLVAVVSTDPGSTRRLLDLLVPSTGEVPPWMSPERAGATEALHLVEAALDEMVGGPSLLELADRAHRGAAPETAPGAALEGDLPGRRPRAVPDRTSLELPRIESQLRNLRADHAEVAGDLEVATMEWLRERQDAETHLQSYRDRARELKVRLSDFEDGGRDTPCPTCGRPLGDHYEEVLAELRDEWESVVQDGRWWKRRREQLELKPDHLLELEGRVIRLQAAVEACAERMEAARSRSGERHPAGAGVELGGPATGRLLAGTESGAEAGKVRRAVEEARVALRAEVLEIASGYVCRITASRVLALSEAEGEVVLDGPMAAVRPNAEADVAAAEIALRLAGVGLAGPVVGVDPDLVLSEALVEALREEDRLRLVDLLAGTRTGVGRVVLGLRPESAERRPEILDHVLEIRTDAAGSPFRWLASGASRIVLP